jgi:polysaccharide deacetylase 2 family uncharacterized protein YibQ
VRRAFGWAVGLAVVAALGGLAAGIGERGVWPWLPQAARPSSFAEKAHLRPRARRAEGTTPAAPEERAPEAPRPSREARGHARPRPEHRREPEAPGAGRAAIIIDDLGRSLDEAVPFLDIDADLTFSILPSSPRAEDVARRVAAEGRCVMLHLPMQPLDASQPLEPHTIKLGMSDAEIATIVEDALARVPEASGVNNHMGSRATADRRVMDAVMAALAPKGLFFVDSRTGPHSVAMNAAEAAGVPTLGRDLFLDARGEQDAASVAANMQALAHTAARRGIAIGIGHPRSHTAEGIRRGLEAFKDAGVEVVSACSLF